MLKRSEQVVSRPIDLAREPDIQIGEAWLRPSSRVLQLGPHFQPLEPRVTQVLVVLASRVGQVVGREDLIDLCWGGRIVGEDAINRCIAKARKIADAAGLVIETVPKVGYRLLVPTQPGSRRAVFGKPWLVLSGLIILGAIAVLLLTYRRGPVRPEYPVIAIAQFTTTSDRPALRSTTADIRSRVVNALSRTSIPTVLSDTARGGARYLVRGQVSATSDTVLAVVQMQDVATGMTLLSKEIELDPDEAPLLPDKVSAAVADAVSRTGAYYALSARSADPVETASFMNVVLQIAAGDYLEAQLHARQLLESRPDSRLAPFAVSFSTIYALPQIPLEERPDAIRRARLAARLARERMPRFGDVYVAGCKLYPVDYARCERTVRQALAIDPSAPTLRSQLALLLMDGGRLHEADSLTEKALSENPFNPSKVIQRLYLTDAVGRPGETADLWSYAQRYWPKHRFAHQRFSSLMASGQWRAAEAMLPLVVRGEPESSASLTAIFAALHHPSPANLDAVQGACRVESLENAAAVPCFSALSMLGQPAAAIDVALRFFPEIEATEPARRTALFIQNGSDPGPIFFLWGAGARNMRLRPEFPALARRAGLLAYWKTNGAPDFCRREPAPVCKLI